MERVKKDTTILSFMLGCANTIQEINVITY